ncbi:hypothetical protein HMPREF9466_02403 [Fusobacterium necrophorum subsp. funduliforme 1_1_36S]|nr:hypothetical protein HMPREF9466_02403 [Fusobacterium necrophorum subsp. funduliforme 1_1_36S]
MRYLVLDDENIAAEYIARLICEVDKTGEVVTANNPIQALELAMQSNFDVCFIDIQMPGLNGVEFAEQIKKRYPKTNFIFVTGYLDYMGEAFKLDASDYLIKPTNVSQIRHALENLRYSVPVSSSREKKARIRITCFGNFEVLADGKPVKFKFDKTKELLAYLVHRKGARCTSKEIIAALWEEDGHDSYYRMLKKICRTFLNNLNAERLYIAKEVRLEWLIWIGLTVITFNGSMTVWKEEKCIMGNTWLNILGQKKPML